MRFQNLQVDRGKDDFFPIQLNRANLIIFQSVECHWSQHYACIHKNWKIDFTTAQQEIGNNHVIIKSIEIPVLEFHIIIEKNNR